MIAARIAACLLSAALLAGACGGDDDTSNVTVPTAPPTSTPTTEASTTSTTEDPTAAVEQAFYDQWDAFVQITANPDPANPLIDEHFTGEARQGVLDAVSRLLKEGYAARLPEDPSSFDPKVNEIDVTSSTEATVFECSTDGLVVFEVSSGRVVDDDVSEFRKANKFVLQDGRWKLSSSRDLSAGDPQCDAA